MGNEAEEVIIEKQTPEEIEAAETKAKEEAEAEKATQVEAEKADTEAAKRSELEDEGKTPEEIDEAIKAMSAEAGEFEIVREGTQPQFTQQQLDNVVGKRVKRLNGKVEKSTEATELANTELALERDKNKILEIALEQARQGKSNAITAPNPDDFDEGYNDPGFIKKQSEFNNEFIKRSVAEQVAEATKTTTANADVISKSKTLESKQLKHYERAAKIGAKDYEATEDKALDILGSEVANHVIDNFDDSHILLYYMGKNPAEAERISNLLKSNPIRGVAELGRLSSELKIKPKSKVAPNPDEEINGESVANDSAIERRLNKLREEARGGDMKKLIEFKRKHKL